MLISRIHRSGCIWHWTEDGGTAFERIHRGDPSAYEQLTALMRYARMYGLPLGDNSEEETKESRPTHRCPVGQYVASLPNHGFDDAAKPMPWAGELYAESHDCREQYRLYFIESRLKWHAATDDVVVSGGGSKSVNDDGAHLTQTKQIKNAMHAGVTWCTHRRTKWRRWNDA
ncbi:hypothetical protein BKG77_07215 [Mycobacteroides chelonae]|nr:hypothetical protein BKG77_07215 [Mycobacteroides chelonae]